MMDPIHHRSFIGVLIVIVIGSCLVLMTLQMMCFGGGVSRQSWQTCIAFSLFKELQTLIAALLALAAAVIAVRPVYLQLTKMTTQTEISARDIIERRLNQIAELTEADLKAVREIHSDLGRDMDHEQLNFNLPYNFHRAHQVSSDLSSVVFRLHKSQERKIGTTAIEFARGSLTDKTIALRDCLSDICAPATVHEASDEQMAQIEKRSNEAETELLDCWSALNGALNRFQITCEAERYQIRKRIRAIDDSIISPPD